MDSDLLFWLPHVGHIALTRNTALVGHGGWGDARLGVFSPTEILLNDYLLIADLLESAGGPSPSSFMRNIGGLEKKLQLLGDEAADTLRPALTEATERFPEVIVLTHVSPFRESCWYDGKISNAKWLPGFTCKAMGDLLAESARVRPSCQITVLCGHTHGGGESRVLSNLYVKTGSAQYGRPDFRIIEVK
jgi:hypothetical protein